MRNEPPHSPKDEGGPSNWRDSRGNDRRRKRKPRYEDGEAVELVAAGFADPREDRSRDNSRQNSRGRDDYRGDGNQRREWRRRTRDNPRPDLTPE